MKKLLLLILIGTISVPGFSQSGKKYRNERSFTPAMVNKSVKVNDSKEYAKIVPAFTQPVSSETDLRAVQEELKPLFSFPDGYYFVGLTYNNVAFSEYIPYLIAPAYYGGAPWKNLSTGADSYEWAFHNPKYGLGSSNVENEDIWMSITDENPDIVYPNGDFITPALMAMAGDEAKIYSWGPNMQFAGGVMFCGGRAEQPQSMGQLFQYGATNVDHFNKGLAVRKVSPNEYAFGTNERDVSSVCELFSKPAHPYVLDNVRIAMSVFTAPAGWEFEIIIHRMKDGVPTDVIARSICTTEEVYSDPYDDRIFTMPFNGFIVKTEGGMELTMSELEIEDEILIELTGYYGNSDIKLAVTDQDYQSEDGKVTAYVYRDIKEGGKVVERRLYRSDKYIGIKTSLLFNLDITYSFLVADDSTFEVPEEGGSKSFDVISYYAPTAIDDDGNEYDVLEFENLPDWVTPKVEFDEKEWKMTISFTAEKLPEDKENRSAIVSAFIPGSNLDFTITQAKGNPGSIGSDKVKDINIVNTDNSIKLSYSTGYSSVYIYNMSGQYVGSYILPVDGIFEIPTTKLSKGVYVLKFRGERSKSVKIVR